MGPLRRNTLFLVPWPTHSLAVGGGFHFKRYPGIKGQEVWSSPVTVLLLVILGMCFTTQSAHRWQMGHVWPILIGGVAEFLYTTWPTDSPCKDRVGLLETRYLFEVAWRGSLNYIPAHVACKACVPGEAHIRRHYYDPNELKVIQGKPVLSLSSFSPATTFPYFLKLIGVGNGRRVRKRGLAR